LNRTMAEFGDVLSSADDEETVNLVSPVVTGNFSRALASMPSETPCKLSPHFAEAAEAPAPSSQMGIRRPSASSAPRIVTIRKEKAADKMGFWLSDHPLTQATIFTSLTDDGTARAAGVVPGDILQAINGWSVSGSEEAIKKCNSLAGELQLQVASGLRQVTLRRHSNGSKAATTGFGIEWRLMMSGRESKPVVSKLVEGSDAKLSGQIAEGDVLIAINGDRASSIDAVQRLCREATELQLTLSYFAETERKWSITSPLSLSGRFGR